MTVKVMIPAVFRRYVNKQESIDTVVDAIRQVLQGEVYLSSRMTSRLLHRIRGDTVLEQDPVENLSNRELQVFEMLGRGMTTQHRRDRIARHHAYNHENNAQEDKNHGDGQEGTCNDVS